jgi:hypothetical protein
VAISAIQVNPEKLNYWTIMDRDSLANCENCSNARRCAAGTICAYISIVVEMREWGI